MTRPEKTIANIAEAGAVAAFLFGVHAFFQLAQLVTEPSLFALGLAALLLSASFGSWAVRAGIKARRLWARDAYEAFLWVLVALSIALVAWVLAPSQIPRDQDMRDAQQFAQRVLPVAAIPWLAVLAYDLWRVRRPAVRALLTQQHAEAR